LSNEALEGLRTAMQLLTSKRATRWRHQYVCEHVIYNYKHANSCIAFNGKCICIGTTHCSLQMVLHRCCSWQLAAFTNSNEALRGSKQLLAVHELARASLQLYAHHCVHQYHVELRM
jgi:hypothetical protein